MDICMYTTTNTVCFHTSTYTNKHVYMPIHRQSLCAYTQTYTLNAWRKYK